MSAKQKSGRRPGSIYLEPDSLLVVIPAVTAALLVGGVSFLMSWDALRVVGRWAGINPSRTWGLPLAIDASILVFSALWLIARRRGLPTWFHVMAVTLFTLGSVGGNVSHALADGTGQGWQVGVGAVAAAAFPLTVFATTHAVAGLLVDPDADVRAARRASRRVKVGPAHPAPASVVVAPVETPTSSADVSRRPAASGVPATPAPLGSRAAMRAAILALHDAEPGLSNRAVAARLGTSHSTVARTLEAAAADPGASAASTRIETDTEPGRAGRRVTGLGGEGKVERPGKATV
ncbi:MAG: helix-turn-helix domain-containing protein [Cellulomonas sp.]|uniref:DUF2637 domain-containing protein n=1 Tax=Cellulomonas sp. TaxID=40001 RepID=UPI0025869AB9|nr:DUF2637 domain-containing protein [Cellulomonas sp.]MCR6706177.1 helix-turn-helix domain-containing protein [Cellulomonas sp.]